MLVKRKDRILLTRSIEANEKLKKQLANKNLEILECNLIEYKLLPFDIETIKKYSGLVITSNFVAHNLPIAPYKEIQIYVVGTESAGILLEKKYNIKYCAPNATILKSKLLNISEKLLYLSGNHITIDMPDYVDRFIYYEVIYLKSLTKIQKAKFNQGFNYILVYSENCAKTLLKLFKDNDLINSLVNSTIVAISSKVGLVFKDSCRNIIIANNAENMLRNLE
ncbi:MAG: hypothetical protein EKK61_04595 [Rickettsiales bacterium]|nr:MAG: hypothetical protein EKK61_04595 [Rickettsiales bacterium]